MYTDFQVLGKNQKGANFVTNFAFDQTNSFFIRLFVFCLLAPFPREYTVSRGVPKIKIVRILMKKNYPKNGKN